MRASNNKFIRTCQFVFLAIAVLALAVFPGTLVSASDVSRSARESLRQANLGNVPLVDAVTPKPDMAGKSVLYVDGEYYKAAARDVTDFVCSTAREGRAIVVLGSDLKDVCEGLGIGYDKVLYMDDQGTKTEAPILAAALKLYPDHLVDGVPFVAQSQVCGGKKVSVASAMGHLQGFLEREAQRTFKGAAAPLKAVDDSAVIQATTRGDPPYYAESDFRETTYDAGSTGTFGIKRSYQRLYNDGSNDYEWRVVKYILEMVPGYVKNNSRNGWRNDWSWLKTYPYIVPPPTAGTASIEHCPTTTVGTTTVSGTVGVQAGSNGAAVTASVGVSYSLPDVQVYDSSESNYPVCRFELQHQMNESGAVGKYTYQHIPAVSLRLPGLEHLTSDEYYRAQWARKNIVWTHITTPWIEVMGIGL